MRLILAPVTLKLCFSVLIMSDQRTEVQKKLDEMLFRLQLESKLSVFAWLYLIGDRPSELSHQEIIELAITATSVRLQRLDIPDKFPLGLILIWGDASLAACNINPDKNRVMLFTASIEDYILNQDI
jgi:hypothetical protein